MLCTNPMSVAFIITMIGEIVTGAIEWMGQFVATIAETPLLLFFVVFGLVGTGVGLIRRLIRL